VTQCAFGQCRVIRLPGPGDPARTGLTDGVDRFDRCGLSISRVFVLLHSRVGYGGCWFLRSIAL
jgi:hypothetical protein